MSRACWLNGVTGAAWPLIGMVHLSALPGSPGETGTLDDTVRRAVTDARRLVAGGMHAVLVENFGDAPFFPGAVPPVTVAALTRAVLAVREAVAVPVGVNVLRNDACAALAVAHVTGAAFVRVNVLTGAMVTDQGLIQGEAHRLALDRRALGATAVRVLADVDVKHAAPLAPVPLAQAAHDTLARGGADGLLVSGSGTGHPPTAAALREVCEGRGSSAAPVLLGSGLAVATAGDLVPWADGAVVGTCLREGGDVHAPVDESRVRDLVAAVGAAREAASSG